MDNRMPLAFAVMLSVVPFTTSYAATFTMRVDTYFKQSTEQASDLPASKKCFLAKGAKIGATNNGSVRSHYSIRLAGPLGSCGFSEGYLFEDHVTISGDSGGGYTLPLANGSFGSAWCACRNVGTSPHIGQDMNADGVERAVAIAKGTVQSIDFDASCGYILSMKDSGGAIWRYVHLNQPGVSSGASVSKGQQLATISSYPKAGCGTGPHLHYERRSAGAFGDSSTGKNCGQGFRSCNWDPVTPFRSRVSSLSDMPVRISDARPDTSSSVPALACKVAPSDYPRIDIGMYEGLPRADKANILIGLTYEYRNGQRVAVANASFAENGANVCKPGSRSRCLVSWSLFNQTTDGHWYRVFHDPAVMNVRAGRVSEEAFCAAKGWNGRSLIVLRALDGQRYVADFLDKN